MQSNSSFLIPHVTRKTWGLVGLLLNIFPLPGLGSIVAGLKAKHGVSVVVGLVLAAVNVSAITMNYLQPEARWVTATVFVVWATSILFGIAIYKKGQ